MNIFERVNGKKTYLVVLGGFLAVVGAYLQGQVDVAGAINQVIILLGIGAVRHGVAKK